MAYEFNHVFDFTGGENIAASPDNLAKNECLIFRNAVPSLRGGCRKRRGISLHDIGTTLAGVASDKMVKRVIEFERRSSAGIVKETLILVDSKLYKVGSTTPILSGINYVSHIVYRDKLYFLTGTDYKVYDGTTVASVTDSAENNMLAQVKKCHYLGIIGNRVFASGNPDDPNALYFSELAQPNSFRAASGNPMMALTADGDIITGMAEYHGAMIVFKSRHIYAWFGIDPKTDVEFVKINAHTGTKSPRSIHAVGNFLYYLGEDGIYALRGAYKDVISTVEISKNLKPLMKNIVHTNDYANSDICAVFYDGKYMLACHIPEFGGTGNNVVITAFHDIVQDDSAGVPMGVFTGLRINDFLPSLDGKLYMGSANKPEVYFLTTDSYNDLGQPIEFRVKLAPRSMDVPIHIKKFRNGFLALRQFDYTEAENFTVSIKVDYVEKVVGDMTPDESLIWGLRNWGDSRWGFTDMVSKRFKIKEKGKRLILEVIDHNIDHNFELYGVGVEFKIKRPDKNK